MSECVSVQMGVCTDRLEFKVSTVHLKALNQVGKKVKGTLVLVHTGHY